MANLLAVICIEFALVEHWVLHPGRRIGYNTCPSGLFTCTMELIMAFVPFLSLLSIIGNLAVSLRVVLVELLYFR